MALKKERVRLPLNDKINILSEVDKGVKTITLAEKYNISPTTIYHWKKDREQLLNCFKSKDINYHNSKTVRDPVNKDLENAVYKWFLERLDMGEPITGPMIREKAVILNKKLKGVDSFKASNGWLQAFKKRHGIQLMNIHARKSANVDATINFCFEFQNIIEEEEYDIDWVWNVAETELIWKDLPECTLVGNQAYACEGRKTNKERVSVLVCGNATGKLTMPLLVIGKFRNPRCLKNLKTLPVLYKAQRSSLMDYETFLDWYEHHFIRRVKLMQEESGKTGKVLLLLNNAKVYPPKEVLEAIDPNFKIKYLPHNVSTLIQPLEQGIIEKMKRVYKKNLLENLLLAENHETVENFIRILNVKDCCYMIAQAFDTLTENDLRNGWNKILGRTSLNDVEPLDESLTNESLSSMVQKIKGLETTTLQNITKWIQKDTYDPELQLSRDEQIPDLEPENQEAKLKNVATKRILQAFNICYEWAGKQEVFSPEEVQVLKKFKDFAGSQVSSLNQSFLLR